MPVLRGEAPREYGARIERGIVGTAVEKKWGFGAEGRSP